MKGFDEALACYVDETEPTAADLDRLRWRLRESLAGEGDLHRLLQELPDPPLGAEQRVKRRLARPAPVRVPWATIGLVGAAAAAALLLMVPGDEVQVVDRALDSPDALVALDLGDVQLAWQGSGELRGVPEALSVDWQQGLFRAEVTPQRGIELVVATPEARVDVHGTAFEVVRDPLGTTVRVERGAVGLACSDGVARELKAGEGATCVGPEVAVADAEPAGLAEVAEDEVGADRDPEAGVSAPPVELDAPVTARLVRVDKEAAPELEHVGEAEELEAEAPVIPNGVTHVEVIAPTLPDELGSGEREPERSITYAVGTVQVTGGASVWLVSKEHGTHMPGEIPRGRYQWKASFPGEPGTSSGWLTVEPGGYVNLSCSELTQRCRVE